MKNKIPPLTILVLMLVSCSPVSTSTPTETSLPSATLEIYSTPSNTPSANDVAERAIAEKEIISFMLDGIIQEPDGERTNYVQTSGQPWLNAPPSATLIVYSPANKTNNKNPWEQIEFGEPIKVWWYFDNNLVEATDKQVSVQKYSEYYIYNSHDWKGRYEFGILSISIDNKKAIIYETISSCPECAGGMILTVEKNDSGAWKITDSEILWLS